MRMMRPDTGECRKNNGRKRRSNRQMHMVGRWKLFCCEEEHERRDNDQSSTDTQQAGQYSDNTTDCCVRHEK